MPPLEIALSVFALLWGAAWGSFLNVVIHRLPRSESVLAPPSRCPACGRRIRWYHNIPILSYVALGGRCAFCKAPISVRYPLVELISAMLSLAAWFAAAYNPLIPTLQAALADYVFLFFFVMALTAITFIDLEHMIVPDVISLPGTALGLAFSALLGGYHDLSLLHSAIGAAAGAAVIALVIGLYFLFTHQVGMGWGDAKLMAFIGAFLGWKSLVFVLLAGSLQGLLYAAAMLALKKSPAPLDDEERPASKGKIKVPFGPFLALAGLEWLFFSTWIQGRFVQYFML